jgi:hypothetical protein
MKTLKNEPKITVKKTKLLDGKPVHEQDWSNPKAPINYGEEKTEIPVFIEENDNTTQSEIVPTSAEEPEKIQEISDELYNFIEADKKPDKKDKENLPAVNKDDVKAAEKTAAGMLIVISKALGVFGINSHIDDEAAKDWAADVAPVMEKYKVLANFDSEKWEIEITAVKATAGLVMGVVMGIAQSKADKEELQALKQKQEA